MQLGRTIRKAFAAYSPKNPFEVAKEEIKDITPSPSKEIETNFGSITIDYNNRSIIGMGNGKRFTISTVVPISVTQYIDMILEEEVFYEIEFERIDKGHVDNFKLKGNIKEIGSKIQKMGYVGHPSYFMSSLVLLVSDLLTNTNGKVVRGIFRSGVFWNNDLKKLFINQIEYVTPTSNEVKTALEYIEFIINDLFRGNHMTVNKGLGTKERTYEDLRKILISVFKWSLGAPLTFASKQRFGANANKEYQTPLLLGDRDTYKTSILEAMLSMWRNYGENVLAAGEMDTEKQLARTMEATTLPCVGDEAGHIMSQESLTTMLKTSTTSTTSRTRERDGASERSLALRTPALTTNISAGSLNKTGLNRFQLIVLTYSMSFYKNLTKEEKRRYKEEKVNFGDKLQPIADYLFYYWSTIEEEESKQLMIGDVDEIGTMLIKELYDYADLEIPTMMSEFYYENDDLVENPELIDKEFIKDAMQKSLFKYIKQLQSENFRDFEDYSPNYRIEHAINKSPAMVLFNGYVYLTSAISRIAQMQDKFTHKQIGEKLGYKITKIPKAAPMGGAKAIKIPEEQFKAMVM